MTDRFVRQLIIGSATLAVLAVFFNAPTAVRVPVVLLFALLMPGLAITRFIPTIKGIDRLALAAASSVATVVMTSLLFVARDAWRGAPVLLMLAICSVVLAVLPSQAPWQRDRLERERERNEEILARKRAQDQAYEWVRSEAIAERREGLLALSHLLEDDERYDEATRLRVLARQATPPRLALGDPAVADAELRRVHERARSDDPETRRQGLFEIAELIDDASHDDAETLRDLANQGEI